MKHFKWVDLDNPEYSYYLGITHYPPRSRFAMHDHDFAELTLILEGEGSNLCHRNKYPLSRGSLFFIRPETIHSLVAGEEGMNLANLAFPHEFALEIENRYFPDEQGYFRNPSSSGIPVQTRGDTHSQLSAVLYEAAGKERSRFNLDLTLMNIYGILRRSLPMSSLLGAPEWLGEACRTIRFTGRFTEGVEAFYRLTNKSREHTAREMRKYTGRTPTDFINELKLEKAARQLCITGDSVLEIALDCGFENISWFHRAFKRKFGLTPLQHRNKNLSALSQ